MPWIYENSLRLLAWSGLGLIISTILTQVITTIKDFKIQTRKEKAEEKLYLRKKDEERTASSIACINMCIELELFAERCADICADFDTYVDSGREYGRVYMNVPNTPDIKGQSDIAMLDPNIVNMALSLSYYVRRSNGKLEEFLKHTDDREGVASTCASEAKILGAKALEISNAARNEYALPLREGDADWRVKHLLG